MVAWESRGQNEVQHRDAAGKQISMQPEEEPGDLRRDRGKGSLGRDMRRVTQAEAEWSPGKPCAC